MSEQSPFAPFEVPPPVPGQEQKPVKEPRQKRKNRTKLFPKDQPPAADAVSAEDTVKVPRQKRKSAKAKPSLKFDLRTAMQIGASLSDLGEQTVFLKLVSDLSSLPKGACKRIVGALATVFA